jgi:hypothetical protein
MNVLEGVEKIVYDYPVELGIVDQISLFEYARREMSEEEFETLMIQWAMTNLIEQAVLNDFEDLR